MKNGKITGNMSGSWKLSNGNEIEIELDGTVYRGIAVKQFDTDNKRITITFTALS